MAIVPVKGVPGQYLNTNTGQKFKMAESEADFTVDVPEGSDEKQAAETAVALARPGWEAMFTKRESAGCLRCDGPVARYHFMLRRSIS